MKKSLLFAAWMMLLFQFPAIIKAQNLSPSWAKEVFGSKIPTTIALSDVTSDVNGNIYWLTNTNGTVNAGGQISQDTLVHVVLSSWDCNGNFRWMKTIGGAAGLNTGKVVLGYQLKTDTMGGVYVLGYVETGSAADSLYWSVDTSINIPASYFMSYLVKYDTMGQFKWLRTPVRRAITSTNRRIYQELSVTPSGQVYCTALLDTGSYDGGNLIVSTRNYYAMAYNSNGNFQGATTFAMTPPKPESLNFDYVRWEFDAVTNRFYGWFSLDTSYGTLVIGNTTITPPNPPIVYYKGILAAFNAQGQNIWLRESVGDNGVSALTTDDDGTLYLLGFGLPGSVFCGDTAKNLLSPNSTSYLMSLDTNGDFRWSQYAASIYIYGFGSSITHSGNTVALFGLYTGNVSWDTLNINSSTNRGLFLVTADASTGAIKELWGGDASSTTNATSTTIDKNGNIYCVGQFSGTLSFGNNTFTSPGGMLQDFLVKFQNVSCGCNLLQPAFTVNAIGSKSFQYSYTGGGPYTSISWDFGDGSPTVTSPNPTHSFTTYGIYTVCVTVTNACGSNTTCKTLYVTPNGIEDLNQQTSDLIIYPNPAKTELTIASIDRGALFEIIDIAGRKMQRGQTHGEKETINIETLDAGVYFIRVIGKDGQTRSRSFVKH